MLFEANTSIRSKATAVAESNNKNSLYWSENEKSKSCDAHSVVVARCAESVSSQEENYVGNFLSLLYEHKVENELHQSGNSSHSSSSNSCENGNSSNLLNNKTNNNITKARKDNSSGGGGGGNGRFHKCECSQCLIPGNWIASSLPYITTQLPYSGLKLDIISRNSFHLNGPLVSIFVSLDEMNNMSPSIAITFHNHIKLLLRSHNGNTKRELDVVSKQYSVTFRTESVSFTSTCNLLTYSLDRSGCKTKICKLKTICHEDFVSKLFQMEIEKQQTTTRNRSNESSKISTNKRYSANELLTKCQPKSSSSEKNQFWSIEEYLNVIQNSNGGFKLQNEHFELNLQPNQSNLCLQLATVSIVMNKCGNLFVGHNLKSRTNQGEIDNLSAEDNTKNKPLNHYISLSGECLIPFQGKRRVKKYTTTTNNTNNTTTTSNTTSKSDGQADSVNVATTTTTDSCAFVQSNFNLNRVVMDSFEQFAITGIGGLLVKHNNRRAGLNQKSQICLL